jgi:hypothetical protein
VRRREAEARSLKRPKTHTFRGRLFRLFFKRPKNDGKLEKDQQYFGECDYHARTMHIFPSKDAEELLDTVLEEGIHACFFDLEDCAVREAVRDIMRFLRRMGMKITFEDGR